MSKRALIAQDLHYHYSVTIPKPTISALHRRVQTFRSHVRSLEKTLYSSVDRPRKCPPNPNWFG
jgi:hypothetical protein